MSTEIATTSAGFTGADVDGLDSLAQEFTQAAQICTEVKAACEVIVAVASIFGPFGAAFVAYLKGTVIPWLTKIAEALTAMAKVLSFHSQAQTSASSTATSLPSYSTPANLPVTSTQNYPTLPAATAPSTGAATTVATPVAGGSSVATPPSIGSTTGAAATAAGTATPGAGVTPTAVQTITAITGLVTAIDHLIHPGSATTATPVTATPLPGTVDTGAGAIGSTGLGGTDLSSVAGTTTATGDVGAGLGSVPSLGSAGSLGGSGAIDLSTLTPLHPGDTVGVMSVPVDISPTGQITPLIQSPAVPVTPAMHSATASMVGSPGSLAHTVPDAHTPAFSALATPAADHGASGGGAGTGGGSGGGFGGGSGGGGSVPTVGSAHPVVPAAAHVVAAHPAAHAVSHAAAHPDAGALTSATGPGATHDGLYSGLGQATGLGAGGAALARATLHEAKQRAEGALLGAHPLPFDSAADGAAQSSVFAGELR